MDECQLITDVVEILEQNDAVQEYFEANIKWLKEQEKYVKNGLVRIGFVGVTSSGKSTILNALMGEKILPAAVRPSSGILITCSKGAQRQARIYFEEEPNLEVSGHTLSETICAYGDEQFNPHNCKKVKYIEITSPNFLLEPFLQIVDSPGLNAYGLEYHEALTMETLLPSVDLCVYVVTMKANSDDSTFQAVKTVVQHKKPLIIIQNMLDSVEPKKGLNGIILSTREQVAFEHRQRIERIIENADPQMKDQVDIIQVSARQALNGRLSNREDEYAESKFPQLIESLNNNIENMKSHMKAQRLLQIRRHVHGIIIHEKENLRNLKKGKNSANQRADELQQYSLEMQKLEQDFIDILDAVTNQIDEIEIIAKQTIQEIKQLEEEDLTIAENEVDKLRKKVSAIEGGIIEQTRSCDQYIQNLLQRLNLNPKDLDFDATVIGTIKDSTFAPKTKITEKYKKIKKPGFFNKVGRFLGDHFDEDWGYEYVSYDVEVIDLPSFIKKLKSDYISIMTQLEQYAHQWSERIQRYMEELSRELDRLKEEYEAKDQSKIQSELIMSTLEKLMPLVDYGDTEEEDQLDNQIAHTEPIKAKPLTQIRLDKSVLAVYQLAESILSKQFMRIWSHCQRKAQEPPVSVIWGWDETSLIQFATRFPGVAIANEEVFSLRQNGFLIYKLHGQTVIILNEPIVTRQNSDALQTLFQTPQNRAIYLLVNAIQIGFAKKQLKESQFSSVLTPDSTMVHWVCQSFVEFKIDQTIGECLKGLRELISDYSIYPTGHILINNSNPIYSMALMELSSCREITLADEQQLINKCRRTFPYLLGGDELRHFAELVKACGVTSNVQ